MANMANDPDQLEAQFEQAQQAEAMLRIAREGLDGLVKKGDTVSMEDLVTVGGRLVANGLDSTQIASMLADAPQDNPQLLAEWIQQQDIELHQREAHLQLATRDLRYHMGMAGMGMIMQGASQTAGALAPSDEGPGPAAPTPSPSNPLLPGGPNG